MVCSLVGQNCPRSKQTKTEEIEWDIYIGKLGNKL